MTLILPGAQVAGRLALSPEVQDALQNLARESGHVFWVRDNGGQTAVVTAPGEPTPPGVQLEHAIPVCLPDGGPGFLGLIPREGAWNSTHDIWLRAGACLLASTSRLDRQADDLAAGMAQTFEELFLLYSSSATFSRAEDPMTAYEVAISLAARYIRPFAAAIYLCREAREGFMLSAWHGPAELWASDLEPAIMGRQNPIFSG